MKIERKRTHTHPFMLVATGVFLLASVTFAKAPATPKGGDATADADAKRADPQENSPKGAAGDPKVLAKIVGVWTPALVFDETAARAIFQKSGKSPAEVDDLTARSAKGLSSLRVVYVFRDDGTATLSYGSAKNRVNIPTPYEVTRANESSIHLKLALDGKHPEEAEFTPLPDGRLKLQSLIATNISVKKPIFFTRSKDEAADLAMTVDKNAARPAGPRVQSAVNLKDLGTRVAKTLYTTAEKEAPQDPLQQIVSVDVSLTQVKEEKGKATLTLGSVQVLQPPAGGDAKDLHFETTVDLVWADDGGWKCTKAIRRQLFVGDDIRYQVNVTREVAQAVDEAQGFVVVRAVPLNDGDKPLEGPADPELQAVAKKLLNSVQLMVRNGPNRDPDMAGAEVKMPGVHPTKNGMRLTFTLNYDMVVNPTEAGEPSEFAEGRAVMTVVLRRAAPGEHRSGWMCADAERWLDSVSTRHGPATLVPGPHKDVTGEIQSWLDNPPILVKPGKKEDPKDASPK